MSRQEAAEYLATLTAEMVKIAERADLPTLVHLLGMAELEAKGLASNGSETRH